MDPLRRRFTLSGLRLRALFEVSRYDETPTRLKVFSSDPLILHAILGTVPEDAIVLRSQGTCDVSTDAGSKE